MTLKKILIISSSVLIVTVCVIVIAGLNLLDSYELYSSGIENYNNTNYKTAKKDFKKISILSQLKPVAIYRIAQCEDKLENQDEELKQYKIIENFYPNSTITPRAIYLAAKINYKNKEYTKALKKFKKVAKRYPKTKYAVASNYFIANILSEKYGADKERDIVNYAKKYILNSPNGIYALECAKILIKYNLSDEEKILTGKVYLNNKDYKTAEKLFSQTDISRAWAYLVQVFSAQKDNEKVRNFTTMGFSTNTEILTEEDKNMAYKAIDLYIKTFIDSKTAINNLLNIGNKNPNYDYVMYKNCQTLKGESQYICYDSIYNLYPTGKFAADSLAKVFYNKLQQDNYKDAIKYGKLHIMNYKKAKSTPMVLYWLSYALQQTNNSEEARQYYNKLMRDFPDDYYTYLAFLNANKLRYSIQMNEIEPEEIAFPYEKTNDKLLKELLDVEDYGLINVLYEDDGFIKSWLLYQEGDYSNSARIARDAMEQLEEKPPKEDLRWRLVYPVHFYDEINGTSDKTLILSIIREESYFNPKAKSSAGAMGLMQLMPATAFEIAQKTGYALTNSEFLYEPKINLKLGILYFNHIKNLLSGKSQLAILAYNGGLGSVKRWQQNITPKNFDDFIENIPYSETQNYYKKIYKTYWNYLRIYNGLNF